MGRGASDAHWEELQRLFREALSRPADERPAFLDQSCRAAGARRRVEELLEAHEAGEEFMEAPLVGVEGAVRTPHIAGFVIGAELGRGGMGIVYAAEQEHPRRKVALKVWRSRCLPAASQRRFEHEAHLLARLRHPGIAQVCEAGVTPSPDGPLPYFAMEFVDGPTLVEYARAEGLDTGARLQLLARVADAVQHAHGKGVIHRDLKPSNILVARGGQPKVLDFGVARATDRDIQLTTLHTGAGQLLGTLPYMSPEQTLGDPDDLDTRSDVYALGVVGYELLAGCLPYDVAGVLLPEALQIIRERKPRSLSGAGHGLRGDVETILGKALEKDRERRYESASDFAADIRRHLEHRPIVARPASRAYRWARFARRNRGLVGATAVLVLVLAVALLVSTALGRERSRALTEAEAAGRRAEAVLGELEATSAELGRAVDQAQAARTEAERESAIAVAVRAFLEEDVLAQGDPTVNFDRGLTLAVALDRAAARIEDRFAGEPHVEASIRRTIARAYQNLGRLDAARGQLERMLELARELYGDRSGEVRAVRMQLAEVGLSGGSLSPVESHDAPSGEAD